MALRVQLSSNLSRFVHHARPAVLAVLAGFCNSLECELPDAASIASPLQYIVLYSSPAMPPHLHPRSRSTATLFTTTLAISFLVVGMPHILPCPVNTRAYADSDMEALSSDGRRRRRRKAPGVEAEGSQIAAGQIVDGAVSGCSAPTEEIEDMASSRKRECPVPKPGGLVGQIMGFKSHDREQPPVIRVEPIRTRSVERAD